MSWVTIELTAFAIFVALLLLAQLSQINKKHLDGVQTNGNL
ncbi:hypothetical protein J2X32_000254 [Rheinheimera pacifica]|jgi:hypothetical protein|nr:hypothetical protein [Rheinheimera pacifica]MDR6981646.1 hypothetical protein [Rheinheimera pacifica]